MIRPIIYSLRALLFTVLFAHFWVADCTAITLDEMSLMLRSGFSSETILREELVGGRVYGTFDAEREKEFKQLNASPGLIEALKSGRYAASEEETRQFALRQVAAAKSQKQAALQRGKERIEQTKIAQQAAQRQPQPQAETQQQTQSIVEAPAQPSFQWQFKLPSEIEAEKRAARVAQIAARKKYCEEHPAECQAEEAAAQASRTQMELESLKTSLWMQGLRPSP